MLIFSQSYALNTFFLGKCESYETESECLAAREGVKCVWAGSQKCQLKEDAVKMKGHKNNRRFHCG